MIKETPTFRYDENNNGVYTYKDIKIYSVLTGNYTIPNGLNEHFSIGRIRVMTHTLSFDELQKAVDYIEANPLEVSKWMR